jgi:hypothetical protein
MRMSKEVGAHPTPDHPTDLTPGEDQRLGGMFKVNRFGIALLSKNAVFFMR